MDRTLHTPTRLNPRPGHKKLLHAAGTLTAACLLLLGTACGGGGGTTEERRVSSSPAPGIQQSNTGGTPSSPAPVITNGNTTTPDTTGTSGNADSTVTTGGTTGTASSGSDGASTSGSAGTMAGNTSGSTTAASNTGPTNHSASSNDSSSADNSTGSNDSPQQNNNDTAAQGNGTGAAPADASPAPNENAPPITAEGITGEVLLTMLNQPGTFMPIDTHDGSPTRWPAMMPHYPWSRPWSTLPPAGHTLDQEFFATQDQMLAAHQLGGDSHSENSLYEYSFISTASRAEHKDMTYLRVRVLVHTSFPDFKARFVSSLSPLADSPNGTELMTISSSALLTTENFDWDGTILPLRHDSRSLHNTSPYIVRKGERVAFNQVLRQWENNEGESVQMMVNTGDTPDEVRLCLNTHSRFVKRLNCSRFTVPANWRLGQPLTRQGYFSVDDRGALPDHSGMQYWYAGPDDLPRYPIGY